MIKDRSDRTAVEMLLIYPSKSFHLPRCHYLEFGFSRVSCFITCARIVDSYRQ